MILHNNIAILENDTHISQWVKQNNRLDHDEYILSFALPLIREGDTVIDAGAFIGDHTYAYLKKAGKEGSVIAFEPNPQSFQCLSHNCPTAILHNKGLSDSETTAPFHQHQNCGASKISPLGTTQISLTTIDSLNLPRLDFLKLDIEGHELKALKGGKTTITKFKPNILLEVNKEALTGQGTSAIELEDYLNELGYVFVAIPQKGEQYDLLCFPKRA
jgi:FkbM family methyltransferase